MSKDRTNVALLLAAYAAIYAISVFARNESTQFMDIDPQSMVLAMQTMLEPPYYNLLDGYHSRWYGWSYFALNFIFLLPVKLLGVGEQGFNLAVRTILFAIGAVTIAAAYYGARLAFTPRVSVLAVLAYMAAPTSAVYFTFIHPESLGAALQIFAIILLIRLYTAPQFNYWQFSLAVMCLSLSSLAKQSFLPVCLAIGVVFLASYRLRDQETRAWMSNQRIAGLVSITALLFLASFFLVHPQAFFEYERFFADQVLLNNKSLPAKALDSSAVSGWTRQVLKDPMVTLSLLAVPVALYQLVRRKHGIWCTSVLISSAIAMVYFSKSPFVMIRYLYPIYPLMVFNAFYLIFVIVAGSMPGKRAAMPILYSWTILVVVAQLSTALYDAHARYYLDDLGTKREVWRIVKEFPEPTRIAFSPDLAIPNPFRANACHAWQMCANTAQLEAYSPDVLIFSPDWPHFNVDAFENYAKDHNFRLDRVIDVGPTTSKTDCETATLALDPLASLRQLRACLGGYPGLIENWRTGEMVNGLKTVIYKRSA